MPPPQSPAWSYQQAPSPNPRRESSGGKAAAIIIACGLVVAVIAGVVVWFLVSNNDEFPYTVDEMNDAQIECQAQKMAFGTEELECLRDELPELSDDELRRLDHVIEEQGGVPYGS